VGVYGQQGEVSHRPSAHGQRCGLFVEQRKDDALHHSHASLAVDDWLLLSCQTSLAAASSAPLAVCLIVPASGVSGAAIGAQLERLVDAHLPAESMARCGDITSCANLVDALRSAFIAQPSSAPPAAAAAGAGAVRLLTGPLATPTSGATSQTDLLPSGTRITIEMPTSQWALGLATAALCAQKSSDCALFRVCFFFFLFFICFADAFVCAVFLCFCS